MGTPNLNLIPLDQEELDLEPLDLIPLQSEQPSTFRRFWNTINAPTWEGPSRLGRQIAQSMDPVESREIKGLDDINRALFAGITEGVGDVASALTSPINAILSLIGVGEIGAAYKGLKGATTAAGLTRKALSAPIAAHGIEQAFNPFKDRTLAERAMGVAEIAGGGLGMKIPITQPRIPAIQPKPQLALSPTIEAQLSGFDTPIQIDLPLLYPENIIPEALRPRAAQTMTRALAGDIPPETIPKPKIEFESAPKLDLIPDPITTDLKGGTAAIRPGETILPSANQIRESYRNTQLPIDNEVINAVPDPIKGPLAQLIQEESALPSPWKSVRTVLRQLSPELWRREVRSVQISRQYDAEWVPAFESALRKLTKLEKENFGAYVEGTIQSQSPAVQDAVNIWRAVESSIGDEASRTGLRLYKGKEYIPFQKNTDKYWPRIPKERYNEPGLLERLMKGGMTRNEAQRVITHYQNTGEIVIGPQHARIGRADVPYRLDADAGLAHIRAMSKRIAQHRELGPLDIEGKGAEGVADLIEATKDPRLTNTLMRRLVGREEHSNPRLVKILDGLRKYTVMTKLQNFTIPNIILGQPQTALKASRHPMAALTEITNLFKRRYRDDLAKSGAWQNFNYTVAEELKGRDIYFIGTGETFNRGIAAATGKAVAKEAFAELKRNPNSKLAIGELTELVLDPIDTLLKQTELSPSQLTMAAGRMAEVTQGLNVPGNLPYWASQPVKGPLEFGGQLVWQLKKMGYQATKNTWDSIDPRKVGPVESAKNVGIWLTLSQIAGELTGDTKTFLRGLWKGDPESEVAARGDWWLEGAGISPTLIEEVSNISGVEPQVIARLLDNWTQAFFLGLPADLLMSSSYGPAGLSNALFGPIMGDIGKFVYNVSKLNFKGIGKETVRSAPVPGSSGLAESIFEED